MVNASKLPVDVNASALDMADAMFGTGIEIIGATYTGASASSGIYSQGDSIAPDITPSDSGVILSTGFAHNITNSFGDANQTSGRSGNMGQAGDDDLTAIAGQQTYDAAVFEAEFVPAGETLTMQVVFSSEEYLEYVDSGFNDSVGIWVNGELAELTVGDGEISIDNINDSSNENLYIDNPAGSDPYNTEMDGFTVTMTLKAPVNPGEINTIKIAIGDGGDRYYDSNLLIAGNSVQTVLIAEDDEIGVVGTQPGSFDLLANDASSAGPSLTITAINGQTVVAGSEITLPTGEIIVLNDDGTITVTSDGDDGANTFSYEVTDSAGNTDTAFVTLTTTPCFVAGTLVDTPLGPRRIETLRAGDMVVTAEGPRPLLWTGRTRRRALRSDAPVDIAAHALGRHGRVLVSPNHRVVLRAPVVQMLAGRDAVFVAAKHLTAIHGICRRATGGPVTYVHLMFERHQIVRANGLETESLYPSTESLSGFDETARARIKAALPPIPYGPLALPELRAFEAVAVVQAALAQGMQAPAGLQTARPQPAPLPLEHHPDYLNRKAANGLERTFDVPP